MEELDVLSSPVLLNWASFKRQRSQSAYTQLLILKCKSKSQNSMHPLEAKCRNKVFCCKVMQIKPISQVFLSCCLFLSSAICLFFWENSQSFCQGVHNAKYNALSQPLSETPHMTESVLTQSKAPPHNNTSNHSHRHEYGNYVLNTHEILPNLKSIFFLMPFITFRGFQLSQKTISEKIPNKFSEEWESASNRIRFIALVTKMHIYKSVWFPYTDKKKMLV